MKLLFWSSLSLIVFAYAGYPIWLYFRARFRPEPVRRAAITPSATILLAVHNEEKYLPAKLHNLAALDYPADHVEVIVVSDGSTDETNKILAVWENPTRRAVFLPNHRGKATAINHGVAEAKGEIIVFTDARQIIASDALKNLIANFADPSVGCVSGDITLGNPAADAPMNGLGIYWCLETRMRCWEGATRSLVGAAGCLYAVRRSLIVPLPAETILDDVYLPLHVARQGKHLVLETQARGWDQPQNDRHREFRRKVRTLTGIYQLFRLAPWLWTRENPLRFQFVCHKVLRLLAPMAFAGVLISSCFLQGLIYRSALVLQLLCYTPAAFAVHRSRFTILSRMADVSLAFLVLNAAAIVALFYFVTGKKQVWAR